MIKSYLLLPLILLIGCNSSKKVSEKAKVYTREYFANTITPADLKKYVYTLASDEFEGRKTGEAGQKKAAEFLREFYKSNNISAPKNATDYF